MSSKKRNLDETFWFTRQYKAGLLNLESKVQIQNNIRPKKKKRNTLLIVILILLLILVIGGGIWCFSSRNNNNKNNEKQQFNNTDNEDKDITVIDDIDTLHDITSFEKFKEDWGLDYTSNKDFKIQGVLLNSIKASLYFDYTYIPIVTKEKEGTSKLIIKHGNNVLYDYTTSVSEEKPIITFLQLLDNDYLIVGEKLCSKYLEETKECVINKSDGYHNILYMNNNGTKLFYGFDEKNSINANITNDSSYYIYDISINNTIITFKTLHNDYKTGTYTCDDSYYEQDVTKEYVVTYIGNETFLAPASSKSIKYKDYCDNKSLYEFNIE